ncbi:MAG: PAS domain S-box protein, partial [Gemmatimonadetes bacterium]|nr:PAS domain S-box protein [Gemmatimonadota bacterium]
HLGGSGDGGGAFEIEPDGRLVPLSSEGHNRAWSGDVAADGLMLVAYETGDVRARTADGWVAATLPAPRAAGVRMVRFSGRGDLWIATKAGLHLFRRSLPRWQIIRRPFPAPFNRVNAIFLGRDTVLWLGTDGGVFQHRWGTVMARLHDTAAGTPIRGVTGLAQDGEGTVWATSGSAFEGALRFVEGAWTRVGIQEGLDVGYAHRVQSGPDGALWFSSLGSSSGRPGGLFRWKDGRLDDVFTRLGLERQRVYGVAWGADSAIWVAAAQGLVGIRGDRVLVQARLGKGGDDASGLFDVAVDPKGRPWVAFRGDQGVGFLADDGKLTLAPLPETGPMGRAWSLLFDPEGTLWVGTEAGVLLRRDGLWARIDESVGLPTANVWPVALHPDAMLIGTKGGGLVALNRRDMGYPAPRVLVGTPTVLDGNVRVSFAPDAYWGAQPAASIESRHRVDGGPWGPFTLGREVWLPGLGSGAHTVEVQAKGLYGQLSQPAAVSVTIPPPILLRPVVLLPLGVLTLALLTALALVGRRRREHRKALAISEARMRALVESAPEAIGILDADAFRYINANERALQLFGVRREDMSKVDPFSLMPDGIPGVPDARAHILERFQRALQGETQVLQWVMVDRNGERIPCELRLAPLPSEGARLLRVSALDIRERLAAEARRVDLEEQLRQSQKLEAVGQLTGGVAHDFNNLLTVIRGNLELLQESGGLVGEDVELVEAAFQAANRSARLTQRLLAFSRRQWLAPRKADLRDLGVELSDLLPPTLGEAYPVSIDVPDDTWPVTVDWVHLESAVLNLAVNSRDAMPGGGSIRIEARNVPEESLDAGLLRALAPRDYVRVSVSDTGRGMTPEVAARAFDPFFTTKEVGKGTGLGLSMVYGFASQSGGTARIESTVGVGTVVSVFLPRHPEPELEAASPAENGPLS